MRNGVNEDFGTIDLFLNKILSLFCLRVVQTQVISFFDTKRSDPT